MNVYYRDGIFDYRVANKYCELYEKNNVEEKYRVQFGVRFTEFQQTRVGGSRFGTDLQWNMQIFVQTRDNPSELKVHFYAIVKYITLTVTKLYEGAVLGIATKSALRRDNAAHSVSKTENVQLFQC